MRRIIAVLLFYPLFAIIFLINWFFLILDEVFFPKYRKTKINKLVFIIGVPRSATTYLFNLLYRDDKNFHGFKLWELIFAPSIIQKYFFLGMRFIDNKIGKPVYKLSILFDRLVFGKFRAIHDIGLTKPEEDEVLFLYNFSSLFFYYFYPELRIMDNFLYHDQRLPEYVKKRNINFYYRCIQKHNYVFNRDNSRFYLSKSPTFIPRMESIASNFRVARFIYPVRTPFQTIPSTISLNRHIHSNFCSIPEPNPMVSQTADFILNWYIHADKVLKETIGDRGITLYYKEFINDPLAVMKIIYNFLDIELVLPQEVQSCILAERNTYKTGHIYDKNLGVNEEQIFNRLKNIFSPEIWDKI